MIPKDSIQWALKDDIFFIDDCFSESRWMARLIGAPPAHVRTHPGSHTCAAPKPLVVWQPTPRLSWRNSCLRPSHQLCQIRPMLPFSSDKGLLHRNTADSGLPVRWQVSCELGDFPPPPLVMAAAFSSLVSELGSGGGGGGEGVRASQALARDFSHPTQAVFRVRHTLDGQSCRSRHTELPKLCSRLGVTPVSLTMLDPRLWNARVPVSQNFWDLWLWLRRSGQ